MTPHSGPMMGHKTSISGMLGSKEFAELGLKGLAWRSVQTPNMLPKPLA